MTLFRERNASGMKAMTGKNAARISVVLVAAMLAPIFASHAAAAPATAGPIVISSFTDRLGSVNINAGKAEGIVVGATGVVLRDGKVIADYVVEQVNWGLSRISIKNLVSGETVRVGDSAPITGAAPSTVQKPEQKTEPAKSKSSSKSRLKWIAAALGAVAIYLLVKNDDDDGPSLPGYGITLEADKVTNYGDTDESVVTITATIKDSKNNPVPDGTIVKFTTTAGTLNRVAATTSLGKATATLTGDTDDGVATVTARADATGQSASISVSFIASIDLVASPDMIQMVNSGGTQTSSTITATCRDAQGNLATSGNVKFSSTVGTVDDEVAITNGVATTTLTSNEIGTATVTATWSGTSATERVSVTAGPPFAVSVSSSSNSVPCDGNSYATITAKVTDIAGHSVADGTVVKFSVTPDNSGGGNGTITAQAETEYGSAKANLYSRDSSDAISKSGTATVTVTVPAVGQPSDVPAPALDIVNSSTTVQFVSVSVGAINLSASPTNIRGWDVAGNTTTLTAIVSNSDGLPVPDGQIVTFTATHGLVTGTGTTSGGTATTTLRTDASGSSSWNGLVDVTATAGGVSVTRTGLVIFSGPPYASNCSATISQSTLQKTGDRAVIQVIAKDVNGNPIVDDTTVTATTSKGTLLSSSEQTAGGVVNFTLETSTDAGNPTATGNGTVTITIPAGSSGTPVTLTVDFTVI